MWVAWPPAGPLFSSSAVGPSVRRRTQLTPQNFDRSLIRGGILHGDAESVRAEATTHAADVPQEEAGRLAAADESLGIRTRCGNVAKQKIGRARNDVQAQFSEPGRQIHP
jgi:hypothetical protein